MENQYNELTLEEVINVFKNRWLFILVACILATVVAFGVILLKEKGQTPAPVVYEEYALMVVGMVGSQPIDQAPVLDKVLNVDPSSFGLTGSDSVGVVSEAGMAKVVVHSLSSEKAKKIMNSVLSFLLRREEEVFSRARENLKNSVKAVKEFSGALTLLVDPGQFQMSKSRIEAVSQPKSISSTDNRNTKNILEVVFFSTFVLATVIAFYLEGKKQKK